MTSIKTAIPGLLSALSDPTTLRVTIICLSIVAAAAVLTIGLVGATGGEINFGGADLVEELQLTRSEIATLTNALEKLRDELTWAGTEITRIRDDLVALEQRIAALEHPDQPAGN